MQFTDQDYAHILFNKAVRNRTFLRKMREKSLSWLNIMDGIRCDNFRAEFPRLDWKTIKNQCFIDDHNTLINKWHHTDARLLLYDEIPRRLKCISDPPEFLYIRGNIDRFVDNKIAAVVGARAISPYARKIIISLLNVLVSAGYTIVSGLAQGVDALAHEQCLRYEGKTIAVLGNGVTECYPKMNTSIYHSIIEHDGLIMSEYPPGFEPQRFTFPERNRLIAGLADIVIVIQASAKSGSLITAAAALDQGKDVYVVPGQIDDDRFAGSNRLIRDGAYIIDDINIFAQILGGNPIIRQPQFQHIWQKTLWQFLSQKRTYDEIHEHCHEHNHDFTSLLLTWEIDGFIQKQGGRYEKI